MVGTESGRKHGDSGNRDLVSLVVFARRWFRLLIICTGIGVVLGITATLLKAPNYTAQVSVLPNASDGGQMGMLGGLAAQAGIAVGTSSSYEDVYVHFLKSRRILLPMLSKTWVSTVLGRDASLFEIFGVVWAESDSLARPWAEAQVLKAMRERVVHFSRDPVTGFMVLEVTVERDPVLAAMLANAMIRSLELYIREVSTNKAGERRGQLEDRFWEIQSDLEDSESKLTKFEQENRNYQVSPKLGAEYRRLNRLVQANEIMWNELKRQVVIARVEENRSLIGVDVLDFAEPPVKSDSPGIILNILVGLLVGGLVWILIVMVASVKSRIQLLSELAAPNE
jgi:uncharacterized protein involved in exopolysaccharide biosynthesis